jgi:hypothetical protein
MSIGRIAGIALLAAVIFGMAKQEPEIRRYLKIRSM